MKEFEEVNFLCLRNLGDTFLQKVFIERYFLESGVKFKVFCRVENLQVFNGAEFDVVSLDFYPSIRFFFNIRKWYTVRRILRKNRGIFVSFFGDWTEITLLVSSNVYFAYPQWPRDFFLRKLLRIPSFKLPLGNGISILSDNLYRAFEEYTFEIRCFVKYDEGVLVLSKERDFQVGANRRLNGHVTFAPIGSSQSKMLSVETIRIVEELCIFLNLNLIVLCSKEQMSGLERPLRNSNITYCNDIPKGIEFIRVSDYYVGVDTFWSHVAANYEIPTLLFSGVMPAGLIYPDRVVELSYGSLCEKYPCFNLSSCSNVSDPYICLGNNVDRDILDTDLLRFFKSFKI
jgi:ADP-heptose:LPS heptosyltransferase